MKKTMILPKINLLVILLAFISLYGCMVGAKYSSPKPATPDNYRASTAVVDTTALPGWWTLFKDPVLDTLVKQAVANNPDMLIAATRIEEARLILGNVKAGLLPSFSYSLGASASSVGSEAENAGAAISGSTFNAYGMLNWEIDLWGKVRHSKRAALAELLASQENMNVLQASLISQVATLYFLLRDFDMRLDIANRTYNSRKESTRIITQRYDEGYVSEVDKLQAEQQEALAAVTIPNFTRAIAQTENALRVICGSLPGNITRGMENADDVFVPVVPVGLPSQLLQRRPDIRLAEASLHAQFERVGASQASMYPNLSLTGLLGLASPDLSTFLTGDAFYASGIAGIVGPIFQFGRNRRNVAIERSRTEATLQNYQKTVLNAFREVNDALVSYHTYKQEHEIRMKQAESARKALLLTQALYDYGYSSYLEVMIQETNLFDAELQASATLQQQLSAYVDLYRALGGG